MMAQTVTHLLVEKFLNALPGVMKADMARFVKQKDAADQLWLKRMIGKHVGEAKHFWRLFPDILSFRFQRLRALKGPGRLWHLPAAVAGYCLALVSCFAAHRTFRAGSVDYWPDTKIPSLAG